MHKTVRSLSTGRHQAGFTLIELLVALIVLAEILVAVLVLFDSLNRTARVQTQVTDMQQSLRIAQYDVLRLLRAAGRGGLQANLNLTALAPVHFGSAIEIRENVGQGSTPEARDLAIGYAGSPLAVPGTDILTIRGVLNAPLYVVNAADAADFVPFDSDGDTVIDGATVIVRDPAHLDFRQNLTSVIDLIEGDETSVPVVIVSSVSNLNYAVVELNLANSTHGVDPLTGQQIATLQLDYVGGSAPTYLTLSPGATPGAITAISTIGFLEEYRFYVRQEYVVPGDPASFLAPRLTMAQMIPATELPLANDPANLQLDLADNIIDFQVALGLDTDRGGASVDDPDTTGLDDTIWEDTAAGERSLDDWLFNDLDDDPTDLEWTSNATTGTVPDLYYARVTTVAISDSKDPSFRAPRFNPDTSEPDTLEDHDYDGNAWIAANGRMHRRRSLQTIIDLRNITQ